MLETPRAGRAAAGADPVPAGGAGPRPWLAGRGGARRREEEAVHQPALAAGRVEGREARLDEPLPVGLRVRVEASVHASREHDPVREGLSELGRKGEAALVIDRVLVLAE